MTYRPDGFKSAMKGTLSDTRWKSSILSSTPACSAAAQTAFVQRLEGLLPVAVCACEL